MNKDKWKQKMWLQVVHFNKRERWGDPSMMHPFLIFGADSMRHIINHYFDVTCGYDLIGHSPKSLHKEGKAFDFTVRQKDEGLVANAPFSLHAIFRMMLTMWWFGGIGFYPFERGIDFHLDIGQYRFWIHDPDKPPGEQYIYGEYALNILREIEQTNYFLKDGIYVKSQLMVA